MAARLTCVPHSHVQPLAAVGRRRGGAASSVGGRRGGGGFDPAIHHNLPLAGELDSV